MYLEKVLIEVKENGWDEILGFDYAGQIVGCDENEIKELESAVGLKLPTAYKEFLRWAGNSLGDFEEGSEFFYDQDLVDLQRMAKDLLVDNNTPFELPDDAFVFWGHQGYQFTFFRTSEGDNPPVHYYIEAGQGEKEEIKWNYKPRFTDFLITEMRDQARHKQETQEIRSRTARDWTRD